MSTSQVITEPISQKEEELTKDAAQADIPSGSILCRVLLDHMIKSSKQVEGKKRS